MANTVTEEITILVRADTTEAIKNLSNLTKGMKDVDNTAKKVAPNVEKTTKKLSGLRTAISRTTRVLNSAASAMGSWFKASTDYIESMNLFQVSMGKSSESARKYAESLKEVGINLQEWAEYQGSFNQILTGYGVNEDYTEEMSKNLTQLAYDISSYKNIPVSEAFNKLQSGMSGQIKGLKNLGINLSVANLKEVALAHGITLSTAKMTEAQKATLRYISVMEQSVNIQGDLSRTLITPANSLRILQAQIERAKVAWGNIVSVIVVKVIPVFMQLVQWLEEAGNALAKFFGYNLDDYAVDDSQITALSNSSSDLSDNLDDSTASAKKLKKQLMGFDEINKLTDISSNTTASLGGGLDSMLGLGDVVNNAGYDFGLDNSKINEFSSAIDALVVIVAAAVVSIGVFLLFMGHPALGISLMLMGLTVGAYTLAMSTGEIDELKEKLAIGGVIVGTVAIAVGLLLTFGFGLWQVGIPLIISGLTVTAIALNTTMTDELNKKLHTAIVIVGIVACVIGLMICAFTGLWPLGLSLIVLGVTGIVSQIATSDDVISKKLKTIMKTALTIIGITAIVLGVLACVAQQWGIGIGLILVGVSSLAVSNANVDFNNIPGAIRDVLSEATKIIGISLLAIGFIVTFANIPLGIGMMAAGAATLFARYLIENPGNTLISKVTSVINTIEGMVDKSVNWIEGKINWISGKIQSIKDSLSNLSIGGVISSVSSAGTSLLGRIKSALGFATGGFPEQGEMFYAREAGPELVGRIGRKTAVVNNDQIVASVEGGVEDGSYRGMARALKEFGGLVGGSGDTYLDGEKITKNVIMHHNEMVKASGSTPLNLRGGTI